MSCIPDTGAGSADTRKDAVRWRAIFDTNPVTRAVCRDIWRDWILADQDSIAVIQAEQRDHAARIRSLEYAVQYLRGSPPEAA